MEVAEFWSVIDRSRAGDAGLDEQLENLRDILSEWTPEKLVEFAIVLFRLHSESYDARLWGAAFLINGGCSDDGFDYFRGWLIAQGRRVYEAALADPDSLADVAGADAAELEEILSLPADVYEETTGREDFYSLLPRARRQELSDDELAVWSDGQGDMDEAKAKKVYPRLFRMFWE